MKAQSCRGRFLGIILRFLRLKVASFGFGFLQNAIHEQIEFSSLIVLYGFLKPWGGGGYGFLSGFASFLISKAKL